MQTGYNIQAGKRTFLASPKDVTKRMSEIEAKNMYAYLAETNVPLKKSSVLRILNPPTKMLRRGVLTHTDMHALFKVWESEWENQKNDRMTFIIYEKLCKFFRQPVRWLRWNDVMMNMAVKHLRSKRTVDTGVNIAYTMFRPNQAVTNTSTSQKRRELISLLPKHKRPVSERTAQGMKQMLKELRRLKMMQT